MNQHRDVVRAQLRIDEGERDKPYHDSEGILTIGIGRNLQDKGLRKDEIALMLDNDILDAERDARALFRSFDQLSVNRRAVLVNMAFNLGRDRLAGFAKFRAAVDASEFYRAADEMLDSKWARQVGLRASRLSAQMREG